ncbi:MAG: hypothetical protein RLZZ387_2426 [Chloroflexota bacterium]|jgi:uncharacterized protein (DUF58 family)
MWFKSTSTRNRRADAAPLFDEAFLRRLQRLGLQAQRTLRGRAAAGDHLSRHRLPTTVFSDHRPYTEGDDYRYVDWNAYGHHDTMFVKLGEVEQDIGIHVLLDVSRSMQWGDPPKLRAAQQLAGAIGYLGLTHNDRVHVAPFGAALQREFGPAQGKSRLMEMLRFIERASADEATRLGPVLSGYARRHERGGLLVVCSDLLAPEGLEEGLRQLTPPRWQVLVLHLLAPTELKPELLGPVELEDAETGEVISLTLDEEALAAYRANLTAWQESIAAVCGRRAATYAQIPTSWPLEQQVIPYLRSRQILT